MGIITAAELEATTVELLPSRETLAFINIANITAVNLALAVNAGTFGSVAYASANQTHRRQPELTRRTCARTRRRPSRSGDGSASARGALVRAFAHTASSTPPRTSTKDSTPMTNPTLVAPALAPGVSLLGEYQGSGFTEPHYLIVRADQQVLHVSRLLFVVASHLDGHSGLEEVAARVSDEYGRALDADGVRFLVTAKLRPMGIAAEASVDDRRARLVRAPRGEHHHRPPHRPAPRRPHRTLARHRSAGGPPRHPLRRDRATRPHPAARQPVAGAAVPRHPHPRRRDAVPRAPPRTAVLRAGRRARPASASSPRTSGCSGRRA